VLFAEMSRPVFESDLDRPELEARLDTWLAPARAAGIPTHVVFDETHKVAERILTCAMSLPADLIVMGTHGRGGFERFMIGSVTEKVVRKASCAVLTVPPPTASVSKLPFKRLLCPVDFSASSMAALRRALSIAKESDARLTLMHVIEWAVDDQFLTDHLGDASAFRRAIEERARERLDAAISTDDRTWCRPSTRLAHGKPYEQILATAEQEETDLIVIGVHSRNAFDVLLFGSTTNQVVRRASCPVMTLRA
jgi:nucleotide-binding universal stress UspA family protein